MSRILSLTVTVLTLSLLPAFAADLKTDPGGFMDIRWGTLVEQLPQLELVQEQGDFKIFIQPGPPPVVCEISPTGIRYQFYKHRLESVLLTYSGKETHETLVACAITQYGRIPPTKSRAVLRVDWDGPATIVSLAFDPYSQEGALWFTSRALTLEQFQKLELESVR